MAYIVMDLEWNQPVSKKCYPYIKIGDKIGDKIPMVKIGYLEKTKEASAREAEVHEVFNANEKFIVYEDGSMKAAEGEFTGVIHANGGTIGGLSIDSFIGVLPTEYEVQIESNSGTIFKNGQGKEIS